MLRYMAIYIVSNLMLILRYLGQTVNHCLTSASCLNIYGGKPDGLFVIVCFQVLDSAARVANGLIAGEEDLNVRIVRGGIVGRQNPGNLGQTRGRQRAGLIVEVQVGVIHI